MLRQITKYIYETLLPKRMKETVDVFKCLRMGKPEGLQENKVLILAPHPDDEIISCGGAMQFYRQRGAKLTCVYMTDGRKLNPDYHEDELVLIRKEEAKQGASLIGIERLIFLDNRDDELAVTPKTVQELSDILQEVKPEAVFLPFILESHPDHKATAKIFSSAIKKSKWTCMCYAWGIWTPLPYFNLSVNITPYVELKKKALATHRSQIEIVDIVGAVLGMSQYYHFISGGKEKGWAEVFVICPAGEFIKLAEAIG